MQIKEQSRNKGEKSTFQQLPIPYNRLSTIGFQAIDKIVNARVTCFGHYLWFCSFYGCWE
jgi:hypothetical protein